MTFQLEPVSTPTASTVTPGYSEATQRNWLCLWPRRGGCIVFPGTHNSLCHAGDNGPLPPTVLLVLNMTTRSPFTPEGPGTGQHLFQETDAFGLL